MPDVRNACVYASVSITEQEMSSFSIEEQERMGKATIESKGWQYIDTFIDTCVNGLTMERPGLKAMIEAINSKKVNAIVINKLDRLSRKQRDTMAIIEDIFIKNDVYLLSIKETLDTSTPWGRAMIGTLSSFYQMESENIQMRTAMGRKAKVEKGGYAGGKPPIGYRVLDGEL